MLSKLLSASKCSLNALPTHRCQSCGSSPDGLSPGSTHTCPSAPRGPTLSHKPPEAPQSASLGILSRKNIYTLPSFRKLQVFNKCELALLFRRVEKLISAKALSQTSLFSQGRIPIFNKRSSVLGYFQHPAVFLLFPGQLPQP